MITPHYIDEQLIKMALKEDIGRGDITTNLTVGKRDSGTAIIMAQDPLFLCGIDIAEYIYNLLDPGISFTFRRNDGESVIETDIIAVVEGNKRAILTGERLVLNFMQRLSGIASLSKEYANKVDITSKTRVVDTRKTTPGLRNIEKYAVTVGGSSNHRFGLDDGILIKDNHIKASGSITKAIDLIRKSAHHILKIEVEVTNDDEIKEAIEAGADIIMLDNMTDKQVAGALEIINGKALVEVSGGITLERIKPLSLLNVDFISVGALTHSAVSKNINLTLEG